MKTIIIKTNSILCIIFFLMLSPSLKSQAVYDTLYSFPDTTRFSNEVIIVVDDIVNLAVTFWPDTTWEYYQIEKVLFSVPEGVHPNSNFYLYLSLGNKPEDSIIHIKKVYYDSIPRYPEIAQITFDPPIIINEKSFFYVSSSFIYTLSISNILGEPVLGQFAFWHSLNQWIEYVPVYFNLKVVVKKNLTDIKDTQILPIEFSLDQNFPNPFNPRTKITYSIKEEGLVTLKIYDVLGKEIATLVNENKPSGNYEAEFDASQLPSGIYIYKLQAGSFISSKKMLLLK